MAQAASGVASGGSYRGARTERGTWVSRPGMPGREREGGEASRMARRRERQAVDAGGARSDGGLPAKARRAWGPSFGEGPADRSAEARNARSRGIGSRSFGEGARQSGGEPDARGHLGHLLFRDSSFALARVVPPFFSFPQSRRAFRRRSRRSFPQPARAAPASPGRSLNFAPPSFPRKRESSAG